MDYLSIAIEAATAAGNFLSVSDDIVINSSVGHDIKLQKDKDSEKIILDILQKSSLNILSEECGYIENNSDSDLCWVIDPLDGSLNYSRNIPLFCVSIALWKGKKPVLGVVFDFMRNKLYKGVVGHGAWCNEQPIEVSTVSQKSSAIIATGFPVYSSFATETLLAFVKDLQNYKKVRLFGSAAFSMMMVAQGSVEAYQENNIAWWDVAAGIAIVLAAGGCVKYDFSDINKNLMNVFAVNNHKII
ncbi:inositol phosphatase [Bacteroidia bacterium]|nr:inositol phosphatase [Bacteroidia bacterium]